MGYMRMTRQGNDVSVPERSVGYRYYFTHSKWQAMAYLSNRMIMEYGEADWEACFPAKAASSMRYGVQHGLEVCAERYSLVDTVDAQKNERVPGAVVGVIASLYSGNNLMGFYAVKY